MILVGGPLPRRARGASRWARLIGMRSPGGGWGTTAPSPLNERDQILPRVGFGDDFAHALLVEAFEAVVALQVFQVRAERAFFAELLGLFGGDLAFGEENLDALFADGPALALRKGLA